MDNKISVVMPVKNGENYIKEAILSIINQKMNTEIIVVDDGSIDNTKMIAKSFGCNVVVHSVSKGQVAAKNTGLKAACGDYIIFCDHDDVLTSNALKTMINEFEKDDTIEVVIAKIKDFISPDIKNQNQSIKKEPYYGCLAGAMLFKREVFNKIGFFDENITAGEIISLTDKLNKQNIKTKKINFISSNRRIHDNNYSKTNRTKEFKDYAKLLRIKLSKKNIKGKNAKK